jgi:hypothetical protein
MSVLKVQLRGERYRYEVMQVIFAENNWLKDQSELIQGEQRDFLRFNDNRLDISDYEYFDHTEAGVAIRHTGEIFYEFCNLWGKMPMDNVLLALNHPILLAHRNANAADGLRLTSATVYDEENTIYEYTLELDDNDFDASLLEIIVIRDPIMEEEDYIVEIRYDGKKMKGGAEGLPFGDPMDKNYMLQMPKEYAYALGLGENKKLDNILRFDDFITEEYQKVGKKSAKKYVKIREDYIHSFIDQHEPDHDLPEEE